MVLDPQCWLELRRFRALVESGAVSLTEVARETGLDRKTVRKYLSSTAPSAYFTSLDDMVRHLKSAEAAGRLPSKLGIYLRPSVPVVDEVGHQPLERAEANLVSR